MRLHLPAIPHTVTRADFSHCAFTQKVRNFGPMMRAQGFEVIHYGVEGSDSGATEHVELLSREEHLALLGVPDYHTDKRRQFGLDAISDNAVYRQFVYNLRQELRDRLEPGDVICVPFGGAGIDPYAPAYKDHPLVRHGGVAVVETGIGYPRPASLLRVYESEAWRHWNLGAESREGMGWRTPRKEWVVPNYYNLTEWPADLGPVYEKAPVVYLGRIEEVKGLALIAELALRRPDLEFVICGQGDPTPYLVSKNIRYQEPLQGDERIPYLTRARAVICPSRYVEPFCGVAVEAMLLGTPVIASNFGAFTETIRHGVTGLRCQGLEAWLRALDNVLLMERDVVATLTRSRYSLGAVGMLYTGVFSEVAEWIASQS